MIQSRYAVVADEDTMAAMLGIASVDMVGVCIVEGETARCHLLEGRSGLEELVSGLPCSPSGFGATAALPDFAAEMEALALIADEAAANFHGSSGVAPAFPAGFEPAEPRLEGGLSARITPYGLDLSISLGLAEMLGWSEGDRLSLAATPEGSLLAVSKGGDGAMLVRTPAAPGSLQTDRDLSGLPLTLALREAEWRCPEYQVRRGCIVLAAGTLLSRSGDRGRVQPLPELASEAALPQGQSGSAPRIGRFRMAIAAVLLASSSSVAGFILAWLWL